MLGGNIIVAGLEYVAESLTITVSLSNANDEAAPTLREAPLLAVRLTFAPCCTSGAPWTANL